MKKNRRRVTLLSSTGLLISSLFFVCAGTVAPVLASILNVQENVFFFIIDDYGYTYKCFLVHNNDGQPDGVSIAWAEAASNTPDDKLIVPRTVSYNEITYTVKGLAKHAFRYCDFKEIDIPNTVEQIDEEAFAYCNKLESFTFPYLVSKIAPSTFIDCRNLKNVNYKDANNNLAFGNDTITEIGDHAFDSCVSLREFYSPKSLVYYGESCFKNCRSLVNYYFPSTKYDDGNNITNPITVRPYAFADCKNLSYIYFETNVAEIDNYAFVDTSLDLNIRYTGSSIPTYSKDGVGQTHWRDFYTATNLTAQIPVILDHPVIYPSDDYPCLRYTIENDVVPLDSAQGRDTINIIDDDEIEEEGEYAVIYKFDTPSRDVPGCYDFETGKLTIPETINNKKVKIIRSSAFANNQYIQEVHFSANLVQICNRAFVNCMSIHTLNFTKCEKLKEVAYYAFFEYDFDNQQLHNELLTSLILPDCLEYIGGFAFSMFYNVNSFKLPDKVKAIDDLAFFRLGYKVGDNNGQVDLKLPKSLNDAAAKAANFKHINFEYSTNKTYDHNNYTRFYAVGKYAFREALCLRSVYMEDDPAHATDNSYVCSFYSNTFHTASNLIRFKASKNLQFLGKDAFKSCKNLREVFLTTTKSAASKNNYPWCIDEENGSYGGTLFFDSLPQLVCYVDGEKAPGKLSTYTLTTENTSKVQVNSMWNSETSNVYTNESKQGSNLGRKVVPTYYNIDFSSIKYWKPGATPTFVEAPVTLEDYDAGIIAFAKNSQTNKYTAARYYLRTNYDTSVTPNKVPTGYEYIDLTNVEGISDNNVHDLTEIGDECFGVNGQYTGGNDNRNRVPGSYFVLPETITKIGDRAFYRSTGNKDNATDDTKTNGRFGVRLVTYKNSAGNYIAEDGSAITKTQLDTVIENIRGLLDANKRGYCVLPNQVTYIGKLAFYNNIFRTVRITSTITFFGAGAFYCHTLRNENAKGTIENFIMGNSTNFSCVDGGVYYVGNANKKMLISQANGASGTLTIDAGTKAIGIMALADTQYTSVALPSGLTTIYGMAFANNRKLESLTGVSSLRYIGTMKNLLNTNTGWDDADYTEVWDKSLSANFENFDYRDYAYEPRPIIENLASAFYGCNKLATVDFTQMTELRKIGYQAFYNCSSLKNMTGSKNYVYKEYNSSTKEITVIDDRAADNENVLDLSYCTHLRCIDRNAFLGCGSIKYLHLPDNRGENSESQLYIGKDKELVTANGKIFSDGSDTSFKRILVGETAVYADPSFGTAHKAADHYPNGNFGSKNRVYYFINQKSDIPEGAAGTDLRYWTKLSDGSYLLFDDAIGAHKYFPN